MLGIIQAEDIILSICGVGICNGCPVPTLPDGAMGDWPNAKCCVEGPVFSIADVTL